MKNAGFFFIAVAVANAQDWATLARRAAVIDRETLRMRPVITVFCGEGDWSGQYIGYPDPAGTGWRKIRLLSDGRKYTRGIVDLYPSLGYEHEVRENIEFSAGGPSWDETRAYAATQGSRRVEMRRARTRPLLSRENWRPHDSEAPGWLDEAVSRLSRAAAPVVLGGLQENEVGITPLEEDSPEICDLAVDPAFRLALQSHAEWFGQPVKLRIELRRVRLGRWEGVLTGVESVPSGERRHDR